MSQLPNKLQEFHRRLNDDFPFYARHTLNIKTKSGRTEPFIFNQAQLYLHKRLEQQRRDIGKVRALLVKGRQQGCSTYVEGRYYWRATREGGKNVFILSHESETTKKLFKMVERYHELAPEAARPECKIANRREFEFKDIGSEYAVGTAGNENVGRGGTVQLFHGSEVAFWEKTQGIKTGILQSVPDMDGTEVILESTANGMSNDFYTMCMDALEGKSDYMVVFIPWYWQPEYARAKPADGVREFDDEEIEYKELYGLTAEQVYWRRAKIVEFGEEGDWMFKQEYPAFLQEAFQTSGRTLISPQSIIRARKSQISDEDAPLVLGVDPARTNDRIVLAPRQGRHYWPHIELSYGKSEEQITTKIAAVVARWIKDNNPQKVYVDTGEGWGVIDQLKSMGYGNLITGVNFGSSATDKDIYANKRAEMWCRLRDHLHGEDGEINIPDNDALQKDLMSMPEREATSSGKTKLVSKDTVKKNLGMSPDVGDAYALTHTDYLFKDVKSFITTNSIKKKETNSSSLKTFQRIRGYNKQKHDLGRRRDR